MLSGLRRRCDDRNYYPSSRALRYTWFVSLKTALLVR